MFIDYFGSGWVAAGLLGVFLSVTQPAVEPGTLTAAERQTVVAAVIANLNEHYVDAAVARKMEAALLTRQKAGDYDAPPDGAALATLLTTHLRDVSHDLHLEVLFSRNRIPQLPPMPPGPPPEPPLAYRQAMEQSNCTFEKVQMLPRNIGYVKLNSFPHPAVCAAAAKVAMASVNDADAVIFDLRDNRGGFPAMVMLLAAYLFDRPQFMYNPREETKQWTQSPVSGSRLTNTPVYVLTSKRTFSGAEHFSYDLKMLKRATLVGETTAGAADVGVFHRIDDHFGIGIRESRVENPYAEPDWAVVGVQPNVKVPAADALVTAQRLAEATLKTK